MQDMMLPFRIKGVMSPLLKNSRLASGDLQIAGELGDDDEREHSNERRMVMGKYAPPRGGNVTVH